MRQFDLSPVFLQSEVSPGVTFGPSPALAAMANVQGSELLRCLVGESGMRPHASNSRRARERARYWPVDVVSVVVR